jgi:acyl-ACP thioesterase
MFPSHHESIDEEAFVVKYSDIDVNGHLNSMKYVDHVLDTFSTDHYREYHLQRLEIAYVAEGHYGDTIVMQHVQEDEFSHSYRLLRRTDENDTELCRVKLRFIKR